MIITLDSKADFISTKTRLKKKILIIFPQISQPMKGNKGYINKKLIVMDFQKPYKHIPNNQNMKKK